jgi:hypothetical protein
MSVWQGAEASFMFGNGEAMKEVLIQFRERSFFDTKEEQRRGDNAYCN